RQWPRAWARVWKNDRPHQAGSYPITERPCPTGSDTWSAPHPLPFLAAPFRNHAELARRVPSCYLPGMSSRRPIRAGIRAGGAPHAASGELTADALRDAFSRWASGVTVVAVRDEPHVVAITATAFVPVSIEPPLVLVCVGTNAIVLPLLEPGAAFAISILAAQQRRLASMFADPAPLGREHFAAEGEPLVHGALVG